MYTVILQSYMSNTMLSGKYKRPTKQQACLQQLVTLIKGTGAKSEEGNGKHHTLSALKTALMAKISTHGPMFLSHSLRHERVAL